MINKTMSYTLIHNVNQINRFYNEYLKRYLHSEYCKLLLLVSPAKYRRDYSLDRNKNGILRRSILTKTSNGNSAKDFVSSIACFETSSDRSILDLNDRPLHSNVLAVYVTMNQSSLLQAMLHVNHNLMNGALIDSLRGQWNETSNYELQNCMEAVYDQIYNDNNTRNAFWNININEKDEKHVYTALNIIKRRIRKAECIRSVIETKNGFRIIISACDLSPNYRTKLKNLLNEESSEIFNVTTKSLIPVPGTFQCGFAVCYRDDLFLKK